MNYTVLGATGFIGRHLVKVLEAGDFEVHAPGRAPTHRDYVDTLASRSHQHMIYCVGLTANFRNQPFQTVDAHVCLLKQVLETVDFETLTYLSSTRVYQNAKSTCEGTPLTAQPADPDSLYNLSKLMGESLCAQSGRKARVVRLSNVYGHQIESGNFLTSVLRDAATSGRVTFNTSPQSAKDFISIEDVSNYLPKIAAEGKRSVYNLASGKNTTNQAVAQVLTCHGVLAEFAPQAPTWTFPPISVDVLTEEFGPIQHDLSLDLPDLLAFHRAQNQMTQ